MPISNARSIGCANYLNSVMSVTMQRVIARQTMVGAAIGGAMALLVGIWLVWLGSGLVAGMAEPRGALLVLLALLVPVAVIVIAIVSARLALTRALRGAP